MGGAVLIAACGGTSAPPAKTASPETGGTSHVTMEEEHGKHEVTGPAFAPLDTSQKQLVIYTFRPDTDPAPSCELVAATPGVMLGDIEKGDVTMLALPVAATSISVRSFGSDTFSGDVASTGGPPKVTGSVSGRVCPSIQSAAPAAEASLPAKVEKPPPVVPRLDTDGVAGMTLGMPAKKLPKGTSRKPPAPKQAREVTV